MSRFFKPTKYNGETLNQMWMSCLSDSHDMHCRCNAPFGHLLDSIFPVGHADRHLTIDQIIKRDLKTCHSGGEEEGDGILLGQSAATPVKEEIDFTEKEDKDLDALLAAAADVAEEQR